MYEIEIRTLIKKSDKNQIIEKLVNNGFSLAKEVIQHDIMFDKEDGQLFKSGCKIRLRIEDDNKELTYKGNLLTSIDVSKRVELNIPVDASTENDITDFITILGYPVLFQIKKKRSEYTKGNISVSFDEWPIIGCIMEIEGTESEIKEIAALCAPAYIFGNRRLKDFFTDKLKETNKTIEQLKKEYKAETGFDLGRVEVIL